MHGTVIALSVILFILMGISLYRHDMEFFILLILLFFLLHKDKMELCNTHTVNLGHPNPKTLRAPVIVPHSHDITAWRDSDVVVDSRTNSMPRNIIPEDEEWPAIGRSLINSTMYHPDSVQVRKYNGDLVDVEGPRRQITLLGNNGINQEVDYTRTNKVYNDSGMSRNATLSGNVNNRDISNKEQVYCGFNKGQPQQQYSRQSWSNRAGGPLQEGYTPDPRTTPIDDETDSYGNIRMPPVNYQVDRAEIKDIIRENADYTKNSYALPSYNQGGLAEGYSNLKKITLLDTPENPMYSGTTNRHINVTDEVYSMYDDRDQKYIEDDDDGNYGMLTQTSVEPKDRLYNNLRYSKDPNYRDYTRSLLSTHIEPNSFANNQMITPISSNFGISYNPEYQYVDKGQVDVIDGNGQRSDTDWYAYTRIDPQLIRDDVSGNRLMENPKRNWWTQQYSPFQADRGTVTPEDVYDPRTNGNGDGTRSYYDNNLGQIKYYYGDVSTLRGSSGNFVIRSKIDMTDYQDPMSRILPSFIRDPLDENSRELTHNKWLADTTSHRESMMESLMKKRTQESWQQRYAPLQRGGNGKTYTGSS